MAKNIYFKYEKETGKYIGGVFAEQCPENATELEPKGLINAVFNTDKNKWEGTLIAEEMAKAKEAAANNLDPNQQALASLAIRLMQTNANLSARITALENERKEKDV